MSNIIQVHKFPSGRIIKITFSDSQQAKKAQEAGIKLFSMKIPSYNVKQDQYYHVNVCLRCYELESHNTYQCPRDKNYQICSECSEEGHTYRTCRAVNKKCVNCNGEHGSMSMKCPKKKEIINSKRNEAENNTYAGIAGKSTTINLGKQNIPPIDNQIHTKIYTLMLNAHFLNVANPGSYEEELNKALKANNFPTVKIPTVPNSKKILTDIMPEINQAERERWKKIEKEKK